MYLLVPSSEECIPTAMSASTTFFQNGIELGQRERPRPIEARYRRRTDHTILAPRLTTHSNSSIAWSTKGKCDHGVG